METKYSETVTFKGDIQQAYKPELIDNLTVYNASTKKMDKCEYWDTTIKTEDVPAYDFGAIADFNISIWPDLTYLFYGDSPYIGFFKSRPSDLVVLPVGNPLPTHFQQIGSLNYQQQYLQPKTMYELAETIDDFLARRLIHIQKLKTAHKELYQSLSYNSCIDDLPF